MVGLEHNRWQSRRRTPRRVAYLAALAVSLLGYQAPQAFAQPPSYFGSFGSFGTGPGQLREPTDLAVDSSGDVWVADWQDSRLEEFNSTGGFVRSVGSYGNGAGQFAGVSGVAGNFAEGSVWASDCGNERIDKFSVAGGGFEHSYGSKGAGNGQFNCPDGLAVDALNERVYVADRGNHRIEELAAREGQYVGSFSQHEEKEGPSDVAIDYVNGNVWVAYGGEAKVAEFTPEGLFLRVWGVKGTAPGQIDDADRLKIGPEGDVWLAEWGNNRVQVFTPSGEYIYGFGVKGSGEGQFLHARGIDFNGTDSTAYVLDSGEWWENTGNARVEKWTLK
jgi:DNA-binding beta-propeller fold protein YncE